jgi:uncharacterized membrane protein YGL010W
MARRIEALLAEYGESHQNETNKAVHWVCVPLIVWSLIAILRTLPVPEMFLLVSGLNWMSLTLAVSLIYYVALSPTLAIGVSALVAVCIWTIALLDDAAVPLWQIAVGVFVLAWIGQFWGHKIEGKKPSFLKDLQFLLIGPAWLLSFLYRRAGIPV